MFHWSCYHYKPGVGAGYLHPPACSGSTAARRRSTAYRLTGYQTPAGYSFDSEMVDLLYLNAGDYVEVYHLPLGGTAMSGYLAYTQFSGFLVG